MDGQSLLWVRDPILPTNDQVFTNKFYAMARGKRNNNGGAANNGAGRRAGKVGGNKPKTSGGDAPAAIGTRGIYPGPQIGGGPRGQTWFSNTEFVTDVTATTNVPAITLVINPSNTSTFPWLSRIAQGFEMYRFRKLRIDYTPSCSSATGGMVVGAYDFDALDPAPVSKQQISGMDLSGRTNVWSKTSFSIKPPAGWYYTSPSANVTGDIRLNDVARFFLGVFGATNGTLVGELTISYDIEFARPDVSITSGNEMMTVTTSTSTDLAGVQTVSGDSMYTLRTAGAGRVEMVMTSAGQFLCTIFATGMASTAPPGGAYFNPVTVFRLGLAVPGAVVTLEATTSYVNSSTTTYGIHNLALDVKIGDVVTFVAAAAMTALSIQRIRLIPYRIALG